MNLDLSLMSCLFGEGENDKFEDEEKRFQSEDSKVKFLTHALEIESNEFLAMTTVEKFLHCTHSKNSEETSICFKSEFIALRWNYSGSRLCDRQHKQCETCRINR